VLTGNGTGTRVVWVSDGGGGENGGRKRDGKGKAQRLAKGKGWDPSATFARNVRPISFLAPSPARPPAPGTAVINPDRSSLNSRIRENRGPQRERAGRPQDRCTTCGNTATLILPHSPDPDSQIVTSQTTLRPVLFMDFVHRSLPH
jgi:hypothetical protein